LRAIYQHIIQLEEKNGAGKTKSFVKSIYFKNNSSFPPLIINLIYVFLQFSKIKKRNAIQKGCIRKISFIIQSGKKKVIFSTNKQSKLIFINKRAHNFPSTTNVIRHQGL